MELPDKEKLWMQLLSYFLILAHEQAEIEILKPNPTCDFGRCGTIRPTLVTWLHANPMSTPGFL